MEELECMQLEENGLCKSVISTNWSNFVVGSFCCQDVPAIRAEHISAIFGQFASWQYCCCKSDLPSSAEKAWSSSGILTCSNLGPSILLLAWHWIQGILHPCFCWSFSHFMKKIAAHSRAFLVWGLASKEAKSTISFRSKQIIRSVLHFAKSIPYEIRLRCSSTLKPILP